MSLDSAIPVMCAKEQSRRLLSGGTIGVCAIDRYAIQEDSG